jgi:hypothetical protein
LSTAPKEKDERLYQIGSHRFDLDLYKAYEYTKFVYMTRSIHKKGRVNHARTFLEIAQTEMKYYMKIVEAEREIINLLYHYDDLAFKMRGGGYYVFDESVIPTLTFEQTQEGEYEFGYRGLGDTKKFADIDELRAFARNEIKQILGPKRLQGVFADRDKRLITRFQRVMRCYQVTKEMDDALFYSELFSIFSSTHYCDLEARDHIVTLGNLFAITNGTHCFVAQSEAELSLLIENYEKETAKGRR